MARRRMTLRRIDPWSMLKFGAVVNVCLFVIFLLGAAIVWFAIRQLGIIDQACNLATDVGFENCAVNGGNLFRYLFLLGLLWIVVQTGLFVFFAFLHNLIADLVGGIAVTMSEEGTVAGAGATARRSTRGDRTEQRNDGLGTPPPRPSSSDTERSDRAASQASAASGAAATGSSYGASPGSTAGSSPGSSGSGSSGSGSSGSDETSPSQDRTSSDRPAPSAPPTTAPRQAEQRPGGTSGGWPWDPQPRPDQGQERDDRDDDQLFGRRDR